MVGRIKSGFTVFGKPIEKTTSAVDSGQSAREKADAAQEARTQRVREAQKGTNQPPSELTTKNADNIEIVRKVRPQGVNRAISDRVREAEGTNLTVLGTSPELQTAIDRARLAIQGREQLETALRARAAERAVSIDQTKTVPQGARLLSDSSLKLLSDTGFFVDAEDVGTFSEQRPVPFVPSDNDINIEDNILSNFDNPAYNMRFFMAPEKATFDSILSEDIVVIAETGATGFNITEAQINNIISPTSDTRNTFATQVNFTLIEPHGNTLFDKIRNAGASLGIFDHKNIPFWFEVSFKGYTGSGENSHDGGDFADLSSETRLWRIRINGVEAEMNKGGTIYNFKCVPFNETGLNDAARRLEKDEHIEAKTVGQFFEELAKKLNKYSNYSTINNIDNTFRIRKYAFSFPPKSEVPETIKPIQEWELRADNETGNIRSEGFVFLGNNEGKSRITFGKGTSIESIVQTILSVTLEGQSLAMHGVEKSDTSETGSDTERDATKDSVIFTVEPTVDILSYNAVARDYNTIVVYHIRPYRTFTAMLSRKHIDEAIDEKEKERLDNILKISRIKKKYEYMYSGLNTEVLDYNIKLNSAWFVSLPLFQGQDRAALAASSLKMNNIKSSKRIVQTASAETKSLLSKKSELLTQIDDLRVQIANNPETETQSFINRLRSEQQRIDTRIQEIRPGRRGSQIASVALAKIKSLSDIDLRTDRINTSFFSAETQRQISAIALRSLSSNTRNVDFLIGNNIIGSLESRERVVNRTQAAGDGSIFFVEDFDEVSTGRDTSEEQLKEIFLPGTEILPMGIVEVNAEGSAGKGRSFFSAILNQVYGVQKDMIALELEIRGDPYWLGEPNEVTRVTENLGGERNLQGTDSTILLTFAGPRSINDGDSQSREDSFSGTGLFDINRDQNGFNGVYFVRQVENTFANGKFTQKLIGHIDPFTQEQSIIEAAIRLTNQ